MTSFVSKGSTKVGLFQAALSLAVFLIPVSIASAGVFSLIGEFLSKSIHAVTYVPSSQNVSLLTATGGPEPESIQGEDLAIVSGQALLADTGPSGTIYDLEANTAHGAISTYTVREGDSFTNIANMFGVSVNTILWANNLSRSAPLKVGQGLVILPVTGVEHTIKKGDTITSIAKVYNADVSDIRNYNGIAEGEGLVIGVEIIVPDGEIAAPKSTASSPAPTSRLRGANGPSYSGYYMNPVYGARKTQGLHGYNGIDLGAPVGTPIVAAASGQVIVSRASGYNGGYGKYVVISHDNGTQTLYSHMNTNSVAVGDYVVQGQLIGTVGATGRATGPHLHFEVRGARNPF